MSHIYVSTHTFTPYPQKCQNDSCHAHLDTPPSESCHICMCPHIPSPPTLRIMKMSHVTHVSMPHPPSHVYCVHPHLHHAPSDTSERFTSHTYLCPTLRVMSHMYMSSYTVKPTLPTYNLHKRMGHVTNISIPHPPSHGTDVRVHEGTGTPY